MLHILLNHTFNHILNNSKRMIRTNNGKQFPPCISVFVISGLMSKNERLFETYRYQYFECCVRPKGEESCKQGKSRFRQIIICKPTHYIRWNTRVFLSPWRRVCVYIERKTSSSSPQCLHRQINNFYCAIIVGGFSQLALDLLCFILSIWPVAGIGDESLELHKAL